MGAVLYAFKCSVRLIISTRIIFLTWTPKGIIEKLALWKWKLHHNGYVILNRRCTNFRWSQLHPLTQPLLLVGKQPYPDSPLIWVSISVLLHASFLPGPTILLSALIVLLHFRPRFHLTLYYYFPNLSTMASLFHFVPEWAFPLIKLFRLSPNNICSWLVSGIHSTSMDLVIIPLENCPMTLSWCRNQRQRLESLL